MQNEQSDNALDLFLAEVREAADEFRDKPRMEYLGRVTDMLRSRGLKIWEAKIILKRMVQDYDTFPSQAKISKLITEYQREKSQRPITVQREEQKPWVSAQAPGTPLPWECLFLLLHRGESCTEYEKKLIEIHLRFKRRRFSQQQIDEFYRLWKQGRVHPLICNDSTEKALAELGL